MKMNMAVVVTKAVTVVIVVRISFQLYGTELNDLIAEPIFS